MSTEFVRPGGAKPSAAREVNMNDICVCGVHCATHCRAYKTECEGCIELGGRVSWAVFYDKEFCPIFECVRDKGLSSCAECGMAPCAIWLDTRDPSASDEEFDADIQRRIANLAKHKPA